VYFSSITDLTDAGTAILGKLISRDYTADDLTRDGRWQEVRFEIAGSFVTVGWSAEYTRNLGVFRDKMSVFMGGA
jgi:hypothetical protein